MVPVETIHVMCRAERTQRQTHDLWQPVAVQRSSITDSTCGDLPKLLALLGQGGEPQKQPATKKPLPSFQTSTPMFGAETLVWACSSGEKEARSPEKQAHTSIKCA
jgi:hypothetical protein